MKRIIILIFILTFFFIKQADCDDRKDARLLFYKGNTYYSEEKFDKAIESYLAALELGFESGQLYYNLGNAYFKEAFLGKAILNYLRAQRLIPDDGDLNSNLKFAQSLIKEGIVVSEKNFFTKMSLKFVDFFSLDDFTCINFVFYLFLSTFLILFITVKRLKKIFGYLAIFNLLLLAIFGSAFIAKFYSFQFQKQAVIIVENADCKFEPFSDATTFFTLSEGESVNLLSSKNDWVKVKRSDGKQGWLIRSQIEPL